MRIADETEAFTARIEIIEAGAGITGNAHNFGSVRQIFSNLEYITSVVHAFLK